MNLNSILIGSENPKALSEFYSKIFGKPEMEEGGYTGWLIGTGFLTVGPHDQVKGDSKEPGRVIWNIVTPDVKSEFERIKAQGAKVVAEPYGPNEAPEVWIATFADPDGNYFQLMSPMGEMEQSV